MTNHPRRAWRRKHQRQQERLDALLNLRWTDVTPYVSDVRLGNGRPWTPSYLATAPAGTPPHRIHVHHPRQQQLKGHA